MVKWLVAIFFLFFLISCEEKEQVEYNIPNWLKQRLETMESSDSCTGCTVQRSTYNKEYYYHLYCSHWSCSHCEVYRYDGTLVEWGEKLSLAEWLENRTQLEILWECDATTNEAY